MARSDTDAVLGLPPCVAAFSASPDEIKAQSDVIIADDGGDVNPATAGCNRHVQRHFFRLTGIIKPMNTHLRRLISMSVVLALLPSACHSRVQLPAKRYAPVGLNIDTNEQTYTDLIGPMARFDTTAPGDARGWPEGDFQFVLDNRYIFAWVPGATNVDPLHRSTDISGVYKLSFRGQATLTGNGATVSQQHYDRATNTTTASVQVGNPPGGAIVILQFSQTRRLPNDAPGTGVTDVHLLRPGATNSAVFTRLWLISLTNHPWTAFRFMGALGTNDYANPATSEVYPYRLQWATDRALPGTGPLYGRAHPGVHGMPWEQVIQIADLTGKDIWINVPVNASDDYVHQLALLMKADLSPKIHIYLEYSNEMWHFGFFQGPWNMEATKDEVAAGHTNLNYDGVTDFETLRFRRIAKRTVEIGQQFRAVFADAPQRIRPVINNCFLDHDADYLTYVTKNYGPPARFLYGIAQTGYYTSLDKSSPAAILAGEKAASDVNLANYVRSRTIATFYGLHSLAYEGGQDEEGNKQAVSPVDTTLANQFAAARSPGMADVERHDLIQNWFPSGGELYMQYAHVGRYSTYGMWGLSEDADNQATGKWRGMDAVMASPLPSVTAGVLLPAVPGVPVKVPENTTPNTAYINPSPMPWQMLLVRAAHAGTYTLTLSGTQDSTDSRERVMVDNATVGLVSLPHSPNVAGDSSPARFPLTPGLHAVFVSVDGPSRIVVRPTDSFTLRWTGPTRP